MSRILFDAFDPTSPHGVVAPNAYTGMMLALLPPGRVWRLVESTLFKLFAGAADELGRLDARSLALVEEADPRTAVELLPEYEEELGLDSTGTTAERQARVVARTIARQRYRPSDIATALAPLLGLDASDLVVIETSHAAAVAMGDVREIYRFFVSRDPQLGGTWFVASAQALLDKIKPSHTLGFVIESDDFEVEDPFSVTDRDIVGG